MDATRKATTVRLPEYLLADLHNEARRRNVSVSRLLEDIVEEKMYQPNADTLAAIEETRSGKYAGVVDTSSIEAMTKSILG